MSGLQVVNDSEFTVRLKAPTIDFKQRLAFTPFYPLPDAAFKDMAAFGQHPIGNGPYQLPTGDAWQHNVQHRPGAQPGLPRQPDAKNKGLRFVFYANLDTAYADLQAGNLDVLDTLPPSALPTYRSDLGDRAITGPAAQNQTLDTPLRLAAFRRRGGPAAAAGPVRGHQPATDLRPDLRRARVRRRGTSPRARCPASIPTCPATTRWTINPDRAKDLWAQADAISPWSGQYAIAYNADGGHQEWVDAVANSIKNTLGIDAVGAPQPTFAQLRTQITDRTIDSAFRAGWQGDYPSMLEFLEPLFVTGAGSNDVDYSNREFDGALTVAAGRAHR